MKLFDAHCHLQDAALFPNPGNIFQRADKAGVVGMAVCGTSSRDWKKVLELTETFPNLGKMDACRLSLLPMIGIHPWFVSNGWKESFQALEKMVRDFPNLGIGETGLDFQDKFTNRAEQEECFAAHLDLARELDRPVAVHCVRAWGRLIEILRELPAPRVLLHAFGGAVELVPELTELNCWFSFCGSVTNPNAKRVRAAVAAVPVERLLIETDSPDFPPASCKSPNEPANLIHVVRTVAELRGVSVEEIAGLTFRNAHTLFGQTA